MDQKIVTTVVALTLVAVYGPANAASPGLFQPTAAVIVPALDIVDQRDVIAPPSDIDPDMAKMPPATGARMPIVTPPGALGGRFGIDR